jgi:hypothetical protein
MIFTNPAQSARRILEEVERVRQMTGYTGGDSPADVWLGASLHWIEDNARAILEEAAR